jgi:hypothetical protein
VESLAPAAARGLLKSWERGNAAGAIEVLRALGFLRLPTAEPSAPVRFTLDLGNDRDLDAEIDHLLHSDDPA